MTCCEQQYICHIMWQNFSLSETVFYMPACFCTSAIDFTPSRICLCSTCAPFSISTIYVPLHTAAAHWTVLQPGPHRLPRTSIHRETEGGRDTRAGEPPRACTLKSSRHSPPMYLNIYTVFPTIPLFTLGNLAVHSSPALALPSSSPPCRLYCQRAPHPPAYFPPSPSPRMSA